MILNKTSKKNAYKKMLVALLLTSSMGVMTGCGSDEKEPAKENVVEKDSDLNKYSEGGIDIYAPKNIKDGKTDGEVAGYGSKYLVITDKDSTAFNDIPMKIPIQVTDKISYRLDSFVQTEYFDGVYSNNKQIIEQSHSESNRKFVISISSRDNRISEEDLYDLVINPIFGNNLNGTSFYLYLKGEINKRAESYSFATPISMTTDNQKQYHL